MSSRLPAVRSRQLMRVLELDGWQLARSRGSHFSYRHPSKPGLVIVPNHPGDLKRPLVAGVLKTAGISREEFVRLLK